MTATMEPEKVQFPASYMMPWPDKPSAMDADAMQRVRVSTSLPDLLPRNMNDIRRLRTSKMDGDTGKKYIAPRRDLPPPYVNDAECDEFEDKTIDTTVLHLSEADRTGQVGTKIEYLLSGPSVEGDVAAVFESGMLYKVVTDDGSIYYYNDTDKYEMRLQMTFGAKSDLEPGEKVEMFVMNTSDFAASLVVFPGETTKLVSGKVNGFKFSAKAVPLNDESREALYGEVNEKIVDEISALSEAMGVSPEDLDEEAVLVYCEEQRRPYVDCDFPPCDYSLYRPGVDAYKPRFVPWLRPSAWVPEDQWAEMRLFRRTILPSQVTPGTMGNTYLVSAMAALAEVSHAVRDLFRHPVSAQSGRSERAIGAYWVTINYNGWWVPVLLDDYLPATRNGPESSRCAVDIRRLWVGLLEKCYAKIHSSYANIASGDALEPLTEFTGFPTTRFDGVWEETAKESDGLFHRMRSYQDQGFLQILCTPSDGGETYGNSHVVCADPALEARYEKMGLRLHHGYAVVQMEYFEDLQLALVRLRNPWGTGAEWSGAWSKEDPGWEKYPVVKQTCFPDGDHPAEADRTFWMEWSDVARVFHSGGCCHMHASWFDYRIRGEFDQGLPTVSLEINVSEPTVAYLVLSQEDERDDEMLEYHALLLSVFKHDGKRAKLDATSSLLVDEPDRQLKFNYSREVGMRYTFVPKESPYYVVPRIHDSSISKPYVLGFLPDTYVGNGIKVEFKKMDRQCRIFQNMPSFVAEDMLEDVATEYQIRNPRQPTECVGMELKDERLREFGVYEE